MKNKLFISIFFALNFFAHSASATIYRPYLSCVSADETFAIEVSQNTDANDKIAPYMASITHTQENQKSTLEGLKFFSQPVSSNIFVEMFTGKLGKQEFLLLIKKDALDFAYSAIFNDMISNQVLDCSYHITNQ